MASPSGPQATIVSACISEFQKMKLDAEKAKRGNICPSHQGNPKPSMPAKVFDFE